MEQRTPAPPLRLTIDPDVATRWLTLSPQDCDLLRALADQVCAGLDPQRLIREMDAPDLTRARRRLERELSSNPASTLARLRPYWFGVHWKRGPRRPTMGRRGRRPASFVKWAGSKRGVMDQLLPLFPQRYRRYYEPMVGSGTVWMTLNPKGRCVLGDLNAELMNCYEMIRDKLPQLVRDLSQHINSADHFLEVRAQDPAALDPVARAARTIYLNKTCFNGLYRVNKSGGFNVPYGRLTWAHICDRDTLARVSRRLQGVTLRTGDYRACLRGAGRGDLVYFDPPYMAENKKDMLFYAYLPLRFGEEEHEELARTFRELDARGCHVVLSNSDVPRVHELYRGYRIRVLTTRRPMSCKSEGRDGWREVVITNG